MKVKRDFNERYQNMKLYKKGDTYTLNNNDRIAFLIENDYLEKPKPPTKKKGD